MNSRAITEQEKNVTLVAICIVFLLSALDQTIVSTAMPRIIAQLKGLELYAWVTTSYLLTSTVLVPVYGKLGDILGRKPVLLTGIAIFLLGSALCGLAGEFGDLPIVGSGMAQLVVCRGIQGMGGAALFSTSLAIITDLFSPRERGKFMGILGSIFGLASAIGPVVGGFFTDHATVSLFGTTIQGWRWVFYVNLPLGLVALYFIVTKMPDLHFKKDSRIDFLGALAFVAAVIPLLLALTWGGSRYGWSSPTILALLAATLLFLWAFIVIEGRAADPILPLSLFKNRVFLTANTAGFLISMSFLGIVMFLPLFTQIVQGQKATQSGLTMLPLMMGLIISSTASGFVVNKTGAYKPVILVGTLLLIAALLWTWTIGTTTTPLDLALRMFVIGFGLGPSQSMFNIAISSAVPITEIGISMAASQFLRQMGSVVGLALFGTLMTQNLSAELPRLLGPLTGPQAAKHIDLSQIQAQAMNPNRFRDQLARSAEDRYVLVEKAYRGDPQARAAVSESAAIPPEVKALVEHPGAQGGEAAALATMRQRLRQAGDEIAAQIERRVREGFSLAITHLIGIGFWISLLASAFALALPVVPLRTTSPAEERAARGVPVTE